MALDAALFLQFFEIDLLELHGERKSAWKKKEYIGNFYNKNYFFIS